MMWTALSSLLVVMAAIPSVPAQETVAPSVSFSNPERFLVTSNIVFHMEQDISKTDGSILFSDGSSLLTTDGNTNATTALLTLSSGFITSFKQLNSTHIVIVDTLQHCLRLFNRLTHQDPVPFAGVCGSPGHNDGSLNVGKLNNPQSIETDARNDSILLVTEHNKNALRYINLLTRELGTLVNYGFSDPREISTIGNRTYVSNDHYLSEINWLSNGTVTNTHITGSLPGGTTKGSFNEVTFNSAGALVELRNNLYAIADILELRLLDMESRRVYPICFNGGSQCVQSDQLQHKAWSLLVLQNELYIGGYGRIDKLIWS